MVVRVVSGNFAGNVTCSFHYVAMLEINLAVFVVPAGSTWGTVKVLDVLLFSTHSKLAAMYTAPGMALTTGPDYDHRMNETIEEIICLFAVIGCGQLWG
jgi:hypothetical protein